MCHNPLDRIKCRVVHNREIVPSIYDMTIDVGDMVEICQPGQFVNLYVKGGVHLLPRPISICEVNKKEKVLRLVYAVVGQGTKILTTRQKRDSVEVLGPLGKGFKTELDDMKFSSDPMNLLIVGGGVGTPPLLELSKYLKKTYGDKIKLTIVLGFRDDAYLVKDFKKFGQVHLATDSGKLGFKGNVIELMEEKLADILRDDKSFDYMYSCGPTPMLRGLQDFALKYGIAGEFSLEERMGCGFGACVGCVVPIRRHINNETLKLNKETMTDGDYDYLKVCKDGPVFDLREVIF